MNFKCQSGSPQIFVVVFCILAVQCRDQKLTVAIAVQVCITHTQVDFVFNQRHLTGQLHVAAAVIAQGHLSIKLRFTGHFFRNIFHRTTNGVLTVQCALRPAQHFNSLYIK